MDIDDLIGIPFKRGGRDLSGLDCYGLVKYIHDQKGVSIPDYLSPEDNTETALLIKEKKESWQCIWAREDKEKIPLELPKEGDVLLMSIKGIPCHVGYVFKPNWFLHTWEDVNGVAAERINLWQTRIVGLYRYNGEK